MRLTYLVSFSLLGDNAVIIGLSLFHYTPFTFSSMSLYLSQSLPLSFFFTQLFMLVLCGYTTLNECKRVIFLNSQQSLLFGYWNFRIKGSAKQFSTKGIQIEVRIKQTLKMKQLWQAYQLQLKISFPVNNKKNLK